MKAACKTATNTCYIKLKNELQHAVIQEQRTIIVYWVSDEKVDITKQSYVCCRKVNLVLTSYTEVFLMEPNLHKGPNNANTTYDQGTGFMY